MTLSGSGDEVRVHQVLVNVLSNALDACPHAAQITVSWQIRAEGCAC
nr:Phosphoglycerate transport system sensor protein pgtB [Klebsiella pneumoniae]